MGENLHIFPMLMGSWGAWWHIFPTLTHSPCLGLQAATPDIPSLSTKTGTTFAPAYPCGLSWRQSRKWKHVSNSYMLFLKLSPFVDYTLKIRIWKLPLKMLQFERKNRQKRLLP